MSDTPTASASIEEIETFWKSWTLQLIPASDKPYLVVASLDASIKRAESDILALTSLAGVPEGHELKAQLEKLVHILEQLGKLRGIWTVVESVYSQKLIQEDILALFERYLVAEKEYSAIFEALKENQTMSKVAADSGLAARLGEFLVTMDAFLEETLGYLTSIRNGFPRFYFLSNDEFIPMVGTRNERGSIYFLASRVFDNFDHFGYAEGSDDILSIVSKEGDELKLKNPVKYNSKLDGYFRGIEAAIAESLQDVILIAKQGYHTTDFNTWLLKYPGQVSILVAELEWALQVDASLQTSDPKQSLQELQKKYEAIRAGLIRLVRQTLSKPQKTTVSSAITTLSFLLNTTASIADSESVDAAHSFWKKCLRYVWDSEQNKVIIKAGDISFPYGNEFIGSTSRLVIDHTSHAIRQILVEAFHENVLGALSGFAGSGKNENIQDFSKYCGRWLITINVSDAADYIMLGHYLKGAIQSGCWIVLDELNRADEGVLVQFVDQIRTIKAAKDAGAKSASFMNTTIVIHPYSGVFATSNPGYKPELQIEPVFNDLCKVQRVSIPEISTLSGGLLYLSGFEEGKELGQKLGLARSAFLQFSKQDHYDVGLRNIRSVIILSEKLRKRYPDQPEVAVLAKAFDTVNRPKMVEADTQPYETLFQQLFGGVVLPVDPETDVLTEAIQEALRQMNLKVLPSLVNKILQVHFALQTRHAVALIGPAGSGKTTCYRALKAAYNLLHQKGVAVIGAAPVETFVVDPMSVSIGELFGSFEITNGTWKDGIVASTLRRFNAANRSELKWLVFDGVCHYEWAENLNTVLDDNRLLCLMSGDRIDVPANVKIFAEVENFQTASPATVSRFACVYVPAGLLH